MHVDTTVLSCPLEPLNLQFGCLVLSFVQESEISYSIPSALSELDAEFGTECLTNPELHVGLHGVSEQRSKVWIWQCPTHKFPPFPVSQPIRTFQSKDDRKCSYDFRLFM